MLPSGIELDAEVRWVGVGEFGVLLSESIDLSRLDLSSMHHKSGFVSIMNWVLDRHFHRAHKNDDDLIRRC